MPYGFIVYNSAGQSIVDTSTDIQSIAIVKSSLTITTDSSGNGTSSSQSFPGMTATNTDEYGVYILEDESAAGTVFTVNRGTNSFTITIAAAASTSYDISYAGFSI